MLIDLEQAKKAMLKQQAIDLRDPELTGINFDGDLACEILNRLPAADLVYCKDCVLQETPECQIQNPLYGLGDDDYCSYGVSDYYD